MKSAKKIAIVLLFLAIGVLLIVLQQVGTIGDSALSWALLGLVTVSTGIGIWSAFHQRKV